LLPHLVMSPLAPPMFSTPAANQPALNADALTTTSTAMCPSNRAGGGRHTPLLQQVLLRKQVLRDSSNQRDLRARLGLGKPSSRLATCVSAAPTADRAQTQTSAQLGRTETSSILGSPESEGSPIPSTHSSPLYVSMHLRDSMVDETWTDWSHHESDYDMLGTCTSCVEDTPENHQSQVSSLTAVFVLLSAHCVM
jgi:hypothetical protein